MAVSVNEAKVAVAGFLRAAMIKKTKGAKVAVAVSAAVSVAASAAAAAEKIGEISAAGRITTRIKEVEEGLEERADSVDSESLAAAAEEERKEKLEKVAAAAVEVSAAVLEASVLPTVVEAALAAAEVKKSFDTCCFLALKLINTLKCHK